MPTLVYNGSISEATGLNMTPSVQLLGNGSASGILNSVTARLTFSTNAYGTTYNVTATLQHGEGSVSSTRSVKMDSSNYTNGQFDFTFEGLTVDQANTVTAVTVSCSNNSNKIFLKGQQTVTVDYLTVSNTMAPAKVTLSASSTAPGASVTLSWSGASAGENNAITGYEVHRSDDGGNAYSLLTTVSSSATSGSLAVTAPTSNGAAYHYKVKTLGTLSGYDSAQSSASAVLTCSFAATGAPATVSVTSTNVAPGASVTISWSGATAGANNAITGYEVHRATSPDGTYSLLTKVATTAASGSASVTSPTSNGTAYYYRVKTLGTLSGNDSPLSSAYAVLSCTYSSPTAPTAVLIGGSAALYALPGSTVTLSWSGANAGANNAITGYDIYRDGVALVTGLAANVSSYGITTNATAGKAYSYTVVTRGAYSSSARSSACVVYSYTDPTAPTTVSVSKATVSAGARVTLSWSGAKAGGYNSIEGFRVYRSTTVNGDSTLAASVSSTSASGSCTVNAPSTPGAVYYFRVETVGSYSGSGPSSTYASVKATEPAEQDSEVVVVVTPEKQKKRGLLVGDYDTAAHGWTLAEWSFVEPGQQTNYITVPGRSKGPLDLSTALTGGEPSYNSRTFKATLEHSGGTRLERDQIRSDMVNLLHGARLDLVLPDDPTRYITGRVHIETKYSDPAHTAITITATCDPWRYSMDETRVEYQLLSESAEIVLSNNGRRVVSPEITVAGYGSVVTISAKGNTWELTEGVHQLPELTLANGNTTVTCSGFGVLAFKWREAVI